MLCPKTILQAVSLFAIFFFFPGTHLCWLSQREYLNNFFGNLRNFWKEKAEQSMFMQWILNFNYVIAMMKENTMWKGQGIMGKKSKESWGWFKLF